MHDAYGKESLSHQEVAIDFLKGHLPQERVAIIDFDSLELTQGDFVDDFFQFHKAVPCATRASSGECSYNEIGPRLCPIANWTVQSG